MTWRTEVVELLPWVTRNRRHVPCQGHRSMSARTRLDPQRRARYTCRRAASWHFRALTWNKTKTGYYCWAHLLAEGLSGWPEETRRVNRWLDRHIDVVNEVRLRHNVRPIKREDHNES